jgi:hypothetical protein
MSDTRLQATCGGNIKNRIIHQHILKIQVQRCGNARRVPGSNQKWMLGIPTESPRMHARQIAPIRQVGPMGLFSDLVTRIDASLIGLRSVR